MDNEVLLEVKHLYKSFEDVDAVADVSFCICRGESVGIVGESGCGKSTTARVISGLEKPTAGDILFSGQPYSLRPGRGKRKINMVFQDPVASFDGRMTVFASLYEALSHTRKINRALAEPLIRQVLSTVELPEKYIGRRVNQLSGGECQRIGIARAILTEPELLICDEATSALDVSVQAQIIHLLQELKAEKQLTYLFISHDLALVAGMCNRVFVMYGGRIVEEGITSEVMANPGHPYTRLLLACGDAFAAEEDGSVSALPKVPERLDGGSGACPFYSYCSSRTGKCQNELPELRPCGLNHRAACHLLK